MLQGRNVADILHRTPTYIVNGRLSKTNPMVKVRNIADVVYIDYLFMQICFDSELTFTKMTILSTYENTCTCPHVQSTCMPLYGRYMYD